MNKNLIFFSILIFSTFAMAAPKLYVKQAETLQAQINTPSKSSDINKAKSAATETIFQNAAIHACMDGYDATALNSYANAGKTFHAHNYTRSPMPQMAGHDKNHCLNVIRINNWQLNNKTLKFDVTYQSGNTQKIMKQEHTVVEQDDGSWLIEK